jgi:hypothetical protein
MKTILACLLIAAVVTAVPSADNVVPRTEFVDAGSVHDEAAGDITALLEAGKSKDACASLADSTAKQVSDSIGSAQKLADAVPKGAACKTEGQAAVDQAKKGLDSAKTKADAAKKANAAAKVRPVKFKDMTIADIKDGDCAAFFSDAGFTSAKKAAEAAAKADSKAAGEKKAAQKAYDDSLAAQKKAIHVCACDAQKKHAEATKAIAKANTAENKKAWDKAYHMKCVLDGKDGSSCKVPPVPKATMPALQEPAKSANCQAPSLWIGKYPQCSKNAAGIGIQNKNNDITQFYKQGSAKNAWNTGCYLGSQIQVGVAEYRLLAMYQPKGTGRKGDSKVAWGITNKPDGHHSISGLSFGFYCADGGVNLQVYHLGSRTNTNCRCGEGNTHTQLIVTKDGSVEFYMKSQGHSNMRCYKTKAGTASGPYVADNSIYGHSGALMYIKMEVNKGGQWKMAPKAPPAANGGKWIRQ